VRTGYCIAEQVSCIDISTLNAGPRAWTCTNSWRHQIAGLVSNCHAGNPTISIAMPAKPSCKGRSSK
jgi:hypothetical protein